MTLELVCPHDDAPLEDDADPRWWRCSQCSDLYDKAECEFHGVIL